MEILLKFLANDDTAEDSLLVAKKAHDGTGGDGDERVQPRSGEAILWSMLRP